MVTVAQKTTGSARALALALQDFKHYRFTNVVKAMFACKKTLPSHKKAVLHPRGHASGHTADTAIPPRRPYHHRLAAWATRGHGLQHVSLHALQANYAQHSQGE